MDINIVLTQLNVGASNIDIEGEVTYSDQPEHKEGISAKNNKPYDFWSQWVVIKDKTGSLGCSLGLTDPKYKLENGIKARVKGKLKEWDGKKSLTNAKLVGLSDRGKVTDVEQEVAEQYFEEKAREEKKENVIEKPIDKNSVWEMKDLRIARECAVKAVTELVTAKIMPSKEFFNFADTIVKYIYNGNGKKEKKSILHDDREPLEVISDEPLFPADEIEEAVNEKEKGNSYDNALPFNGKKKALKKVSKAEDFITDDSMPD